MDHNVEKEVKILMTAGHTREDLVEKYGLSKFFDTVSSRSSEASIKRDAQEILDKENRKRFDGSATTYTEPYFKKRIDGDWSVIARGCDFQDPATIKVKRRDGSWSEVTIQGTADLSSSEVRAFTVA